MRLKPLVTREAPRRAILSSSTWLQGRLQSLMKMARPMGGVGGVGAAEALREAWEVEGRGGMGGAGGRGAAGAEV